VVAEQGLDRAVNSLPVSKAMHRVAITAERLQSETATAICAITVATAWVAASTFLVWPEFVIFFSTGGAIATIAPPVCVLSNLKQKAKAHTHSQHPNCFLVVSINLRLLIFQSSPLFFCERGCGPSIIKIHLSLLHSQACPYLRLASHAVEMRLIKIAFPISCHLLGTPTATSTAIGFTSQIQPSHRPRKTELLSKHAPLQ
jgi:hypothetical protein